MSDLTRYNTMLQALGLDMTQQVEVPTGGDYSPSGFVGPLLAGMTWFMTTEQDVITYNDGLDAEDQVPMPQARDAMGSWGFRHFYKSFDDCQKATELIGGRGRDNKPYAPQMAWRFEMGRDQIINWSNDEAKAKWDQVISDYIDVKTLRSKRRYFYHQVALPIAVQATAKYLRMIENDVFDYSELVEQTTIFDDRFFALMYGDPDAKRDDLKEFEAYVEGQVSQGKTSKQAIREVRECGAFKVPYRYSTSFMRRADLWLALGESDPTVYKPTGEGKYTTTSDRLSLCLQIATATWTTPIWARLMFVSDPAVDATYDSNGTERRRKIPVIAELFSDEATARAVVDAENDESATSAPSTPTNEMPAVPEAWSSLGVDADTFIVQLKAQSDASETDAAEKLKCTPSEVKAWRAYVASA